MAISKLNVIYILRQGYTMPYILWFFQICMFVDDWLEDCLDTVNASNSVHIVLTSTQHKLTVSRSKGICRQQSFIHSFSKYYS